jgi:hypothetical protein
MKVINQTNRTILFEEINPEKMDFLTLVGDTKGVDSLPDDKVREINDELLVKSFDEFLEKFEPVVYSFFNANTQKVAYTLKKPENLPDNCITAIPINMENDFMKMLITLIEAKSAQGIANVDFKFENILDMISPKKVMEDIKQSRKEIQYIFSKYEALDDEDPKKLDLGDKLNYMFEQASQNYNNVMAMLPLAIEDIKTRLLLGVDETSGNKEAFVAGYLSMGESGELKIIEDKQAGKSENAALSVVDDKVNLGLIEAFREDYNELNEEKSEYVRSLVVRTFCPLTSTVESDIDVVAEVQNYNSYLEFYKETKDDFVKTVKPLIEKILGVREFFEQYKTKVKGMTPSLLVVNNKLDMLVKASNMPKLVTYFNTVNDKNDFENTIWFGIVPSIGLDTNANINLQRVRFAGTKKENKGDAASIESLATLLTVMRTYRIQTFFNFQTCEETTFNYIATAGIEKFEEKCQTISHKNYSEFAIPCIPNITIIPKDKSELVLDNKMMLAEQGGAVLSQEKEDVFKLWIEGVYVGAAYVAAGIVAAYQCPEFLRTRFKNVNKNYPGVRFDIEAKDYALRVPTTLAKEISGFTNTIKNSINNKNFGFVFSSENAQVDGNELRKLTVYKARSLQSTDDQYESLYKTTVTTFVERMLRFHSNDFKQDGINKFFSTNPNSQKSKWNSEKEYVNSIIQDGDDIDCTIEEKLGLCSINVTFNGNVKNLEVEINRKIG